MGLVAILVLGQSAEAFAWESDMHYGLTRWLALQAGYNPEAAEILGDRDETIDGHIRDAVHLMVWYTCKFRDRVASEEIRDFHFPTLEAVGQPPEKRAVVPDSEAALRPANVISKLPTSNRDENLRKLGDALHVAQDSWSHYGVPDVPQLLGVLRCDPDLGWGHPKLRGGWAEHTADLTYRYPIDAYRAADRTYRILTDFLSANPTFREATSKQWEAIEKDVNVFIQARTKTEKKKWFLQQGIKGVSFLNNINVEDGPDKSFRTPVMRKVRDRAIQRMARIDIPDEPAISSTASTNSGPRRKLQPFNHGSPS